MYLPVRQLLAAHLAECPVLPGGRLRVFESRWLLREQPAVLPLKHQAEVGDFLQGEKQRLLKESTHARLGGIL